MRFPALPLGSLLLLVTTCLPAGAADPPAPKPVRKPKDSWTLQIGLAHSADDRDHYATSGFQARISVFALDREKKSDRLGDFGIEIGMYPYPVISRAYVPGADADPNTPGKFNFWEALGVSYYTPRFGPLQFEGGARLAFVNRAERVLTSPNGCGLGDADEAHCNEYIKESLKTLDTIFFPSFKGDTGVVTFLAGAVMLKGVGFRLELAQLNSGGARVNARGLRFGVTVR